MGTASRGKRLARRYPLLLDVPEEARPAIVKAALRHPLVLLLVFGVGLVVLPVYLGEMFSLLNIEQEGVLPLKLAKVAGVILLPLLIAVPVLSRFVLPFFIRKEMRKRGYEEFASVRRNNQPPSSS